MSDASHPSLAHLAPALSALTPGLGGALPVEAASDCGACPLTPAPGAPLTPDRPFRADARCCTYHPALPNFLVGRILRRGGVGAEKMRARLEAPGGVSAEGVGPDEAALSRYRARAPAGFGRDRSLRCPYWVGGALACGIWRDRGSVCRTWFCLRGDGERSARLWDATRRALDEAEGALSRWCVDRGAPAPAGVEVTPEAWGRWFVACSERVESLSASDAAALTTPALEATLEEVTALAREIGGPLPERLGPSVRGLTPDEGGEDRVRLTGLSPWLAVRAPRAVFAFFAATAGGRPWREALAATRAGGADVDEAMVGALYRAGILIPWGFEHEAEAGLARISGLPVAARSER